MLTSAIPTPNNGFNQNEVKSYPIPQGGNVILPIALVEYAGGIDN
ncbi:hypothetical protein [Vibrio mediterranei]